MYDPARDVWSEIRPANNSHEMKRDDGGSPAESSRQSPNAAAYTNEPSVNSTSAKAKKQKGNKSDSSHSNDPKKPLDDDILDVGGKLEASDKIVDQSTTDEPLKNSTVIKQESSSTDSKMTPIDTTKMSRFKKKRSMSSSINKEPTDNIPDKSNIQSDELSEKKTFKKPKSRASKEVQEMRAREQRKAEEKRNNNDHVRSHYNSRPNVSTTERKKSPIIRLKKFNNLIKSYLISKFVASHSLVLDIGVGKGGDLPKWQRQRIEGLIGIDIAEVSVEQAEERYSKMRSKPFWARFYAADAFAASIEDMIGYNAIPVEVVSCQFTMHYAFASEKRAERMLDNVSRSLIRGGMFIGTIPNSDVITEQIKKLPPGEKKFGNSVYSVNFTKEPPASFDPPFGHEYSYFLQDAVGNVPEYVVPFDAFQSLAEKKYKLKLVFKKPFMEMFTEALSSREFRESCERMDVHDSQGNYGINGDEKEACAFYLAFAFTKV